jgi:hypothetical protein
VREIARYHAQSKIPYVRASSRGEHIPIIVAVVVKRPPGSISICPYNSIESKSDSFLLMPVIVWRECGVEYLVFKMYMRW